MSFETAINITLKNEGGFQCYPNDKGNWTGGKVGAGDLRGTKYGISAAQYPWMDIKNITEDEARVIYKRDYWDILDLDAFNESTGIKVFDAVVLTGASPAILCLQHALRACKLPVHEDGLLGPQTLGFANQTPEQVLLPVYREALAGHFRALVKETPEDLHFLNDWLERAYQ